MATSAEKLRRGLAFLFGLLECAIFGGCFYGWAALVFVLKEDGVYSHLCSRTNASDATPYDVTLVGANRTADPHDVRTIGANHSTAYPSCLAQDEMMSLCFTITIFLVGFGQFLVGWMLDSLGIRICRISGTLLYVSGSLMVGFASVDIPSLIFPGYVCLAIGAVHIIMTNFQIGNYFDAFQLSVVTIYNAGIDISGSTFLFVKLLHEQGVQRAHIFIFLAAFCLVLFSISTFAFLPKHTIVPRNIARLHTTVEDTVIEGGDEVGRKKSVVNFVVERRESDSQETGKTLIGTKRRGTIFDDGTTLPFHHYILTRVFLFHLLWQGLYQLRLLYYMGTLDQWIRRVTEDNEAEVSAYMNAASVSWVCSIVGGPLEGLILYYEKQRWRRGDMCNYDRIRPAAVPQAIGTTVILLLSILVLIPVKELLYVQFVLMVFSKNFLYGLSFAFVVMAFPARHFGKISGLLLALNASVSALQYPLFMWAVNSATTVHIFLLCLVLVTYSQPIHLLIGEREKR